MSMLKTVYILTIYTSQNSLFPIILIYANLIALGKLSYETKRRNDVNLKIHAILLKYFN